ncbi:MAG: helix-turn-helix transcriptional regulator, partial [Acidimicrobiales bacterium]
SAPPTPAPPTTAPPTPAVPTPAPPTTALPTDGRVATVFGAVVARQSVHFGYRGGRRRVDPWHLSFRRGQWYLAGWDHGRDQERTFRLDRVEGEVDVIGPTGAFSRPASVAGPPPPWRMGDEPEVVADVVVDADQAGWALGALGASAVVERRPDGSARFALGVTNRAGFRSFLLGFLDHAEVVGPPELRDDFVAWLSAMTDR